MEYVERTQKKERCREATLRFLKISKRANANSKCVNTNLNVRKHKFCSIQAQNIKRASANFRVRRNKSEHAQARILNYTSANSKYQVNISMCASTHFNIRRGKFQRKKRALLHGNAPVFVNFKVHGYHLKNVQIQISRCARANLCGFLTPN